MNMQQAVGISWATVLTIMRIVLSPCVFGAVACNRPLLGLALFLSAALTDYFDGVVARSYGQATPLGARLDPIADKILVLMSLCALLVHVNRALVPEYVIYFLLVREVVLLVGVWYVYQRVGQTLKVQPTRLGKCTTAIQMACITWALASMSAYIAVSWVYYGALNVMVVCSAAALVQYIEMGYQQLQEYHG